MTNMAAILYEYTDEDGARQRQAYPITDQFAMPSAFDEIVELSICSDMRNGTRYCAGILPFFASKIDSILCEIALDGLLTIELLAAQNKNGRMLSRYKINLYAAGDDSDPISVEDTDLLPALAKIAIKARKSAVSRDSSSLEDIRDLIDKLLSGENIEEDLKRLFEQEAQE